LLLRGAEHHVRNAKQKRAGSYYDCLAAIVLSALSIEAIGNSYGKVLILDWRDQIAKLTTSRGGVSPLRKLQLVAERCRIKPDFENRPWRTIQKLAHFRNLIAHAKREHHKDEDECTKTDYYRVFWKKLESEVETMINEDFATESLGDVEQIIRALNATLNQSQLHELTYNGQESFAAITGVKP